MLEFQEQIEKIPRDDAARLDQQMLLYWLIRGGKPKVCVEIGTHRGSTALYLAHALYDNKEGKLITVDPFDYQQQQTFDSFPALSPYITYKQIRGIDLEVETVDFLFVDGFHGRHDVLEEIRYFLPKLSSEGLMIFHDCGQDNVAVGVNQAIQECGITATWIPMSGKMRLYSNFRNYPI